jgi:hypothetical protein
MLLEGRASLVDCCDLSRRWIQGILVERFFRFVVNFHDDLLVVVR